MSMQGGDRSYDMVNTNTPAAPSSGGGGGEDTRTLMPSVRSTASAALLLPRVLGRPTPPNHLHLQQQQWPPMPGVGGGGAPPPSKMGTAIDVIWRSWDGIDENEVALMPSARRVRIPAHIPQRMFQPRRPSTTIWDLKDARASISSPQETGIKVYKRRWLMLAIFMLLGVFNTFQWVQYTIIANVIQSYYRVSSMWVTLTCTSFLAIYLLLFIPASWFLDRYGLRWALIMGASGTALGSWVKVGSVARDRFWITMVGQAIVGIGQVFILFPSPKIASVWFGPDQVSLACSLGFIGVLIGNAAGMMVPPLMVPNSKDISLVSGGLRSMFLGMAACTTAVLILQLALFQEEPPLPPSRAQQLQRRREDEAEASDFWCSLRRILKDRQFLLFLLAWAINVGVFCAVNSLLSQLVEPFFPGREADIGFAGLLMIASGIVGSFICGYFLDRTHKYKSTSMFLFLVALLGWVSFVFLLPLGNMMWVYITAVIFGFAMTALQAVGLAFGAEMTFPEPEGTSGAVMCSLVQVFGIVLTIASDHVLAAAGEVWTAAFLGVPLLLSCAILVAVRPELRRQAAQNAPGPDTPTSD